MVFIFFFKGFPILAYISLVISFLIIALIIFNDALLHKFNKIWYKFGFLLGKFVSPLILGIFFFVLITPVSLVTRLCGRDILFLKKRSVNSYWLDRDQTHFSHDSFKNQF